MATNPQIEAAKIIADALYELAEATKDLAGMFQSSHMAGYKNIAETLEEINYYQNKEVREEEDRAFRERMKQKENQK